MAYGRYPSLLAYRAAQGRVLTFAWSDDLVSRCAAALRKAGYDYTPEDVRAMPWYQLRDALVISNNDSLAGEVVKTR